MACSGLQWLAVACSGFRGRRELLQGTKSHLHVPAFDPSPPPVWSCLDFIAGLPLGISRKLDDVDQPLNHFINDDDYLESHTVKRNMKTRMELGHSAIGPVLPDTWVDAMTR